MGKETFLLGGEWIEGPTETVAIAYFIESATLKLVFFFWRKYVLKIKPMQGDFT